MSARGHQLAAGAPHAVDAVPAAREDPAVEQRIAAAMFERSGLRSKREEVRAGAHRDARAGHPERLRAAAHCAFEQHAPGRTLSPAPMTLRARCASRWLYSSCRNSSATRIDTFESVPMPNAPPAARYFVGRKNAVAQIRFGDRAQPRHRATRGEPRGFGVIEMRGVHQAPPAIHRRVVQQPLHRARTRPREALLDFADLFGGMDVHRARRGERHHSGQRPRA